MRYEVLLQEHIFDDHRPFESCHASTLVKLADGTVIAAWFGGTKEGAPDVAIWYAVRRYGRWSEPVKIADEANTPLWNPVLYADGDEVIYLYYKVGHKISHWQTYVMVSRDRGETWSTPKQLVEGDESGGRGPVKNKPILLQSGALAAPASVEEDTWDAFVDLSADGGRVWTKSSFVPLPRIAAQEASAAAGTLPPVPSASFSGKGVIQPTLWESAPDTVHMLLRTTSGLVFRSDSLDGGRTWSEAYPTELPNNNSGLDLTVLADGTLAVIYNPIGVNWGPRSPLVLRLSRDNGQTWTDEFVLEHTPNAEFSYPAIIADGSDVHLTYTWKRERIAYWHIAIRH